ncbi:excalibur calcium-binding domain-containing protein [Rhizobium sp.]
MLFTLVISIAIATAPAKDSSIVQVRVTCKQVSSCEEAVQIWCNGYARADGDGDGIPCENVCSTVDQVNAIRAQQGC